MAQFVELTRVATTDEKGEQPALQKPAFRVFVNVAHVAAVTAHADGGALLRFVGSGDNEHVSEDYNMVTRMLNR